MFSSTLPNQFIAREGEAPAEPRTSVGSDAGSIRHDRVGSYDFGFALKIECGNRNCKRLIVSYV